MKNVSKEEFLQKLHFNEPHQAAYLVNPSLDEVAEAARTITHHIMITGHHFKHLMHGLGWVPFVSERMKPNPNQHQYLNHGRKVKNWQELWGFYNWPKYTEQIAEWLPKNGNSLEIGNFHGKSIAHLGTLLKEKGKNTTCYGIDVYCRVASPCMMQSTFYRNVENVRSMGLESNVVLMPGNSANLPKFFPKQFFDFIYIDGDHSYRAVKKDIDIALPLLKQGGIISGHDYHEEYFKGLVRAVDEVFGKANVRKYAGTVWEIRT